MAYVYQHRKLDTEDIFYIGIGSAENYKRAYSKTNRNKFWKSVVKKYGYKVDILFDNLTWEEACNIEIKLIKEIGRRDLGLGSLVNMTDGGNGMLGLVFSHKSKLKMSLSQKGRKHSEETKIKMSKVQKGRTFSDESLLKMSEAHKGLGTKSDNPNSKMVLDTCMGIYYDCVVDLAHAKNIKYQRVIDSLRPRAKNKYNLIYI